MLTPDMALPLSTLYPALCCAVAAPGPQAVKHQPCAGQVCDAGSAWQSCGLGPQQLGFGGMHDAALPLRATLHGQGNCLGPQPYTDKVTASTTAFLTQYLDSHLWTDPITH